MWNEGPDVGDWIVDDSGHNWWVIEIIFSSDMFRLKRDIDGDERVLDGFTVRNLYHPWTLQDAKPGNIISITLYPEGIWTGIFKSRESDNAFSSYCFVNTVGVFKTGTRGHGCGRSAYPATEEQRKFLLKRMRESGYAWNSHEKVLRRYDHKPRFEKGDVIVDAKKPNIKYVIRKVGVPNELGGYDYFAENISSGSSIIRFYNMDIEWVDNWGIFYGCALLKD